MLNGGDVLAIMARTLGIAIALDVAARYFLIVPIPWYATTAVLTLFMYASESSANYLTRTAIVERFDKLEADMNATREKLADLETAVDADDRNRKFREDVEFLGREVAELKSLVN